MEWSEVSVAGDPPPPRVFMGFVEAHDSLYVLAGTSDLSESWTHQPFPQSYQGQRKTLTGSMLAILICKQIYNSFQFTIYCIMLIT